MKAKKVIITFFVVLLFAAAVLATVFVFFSKRKTEEAQTFNSAVYVENLKSSTQMKESKKLIGEIKSTDNRFEGLVEVINNFDEISEVLKLYSASCDYKIENSDLILKLNISNQSLNHLYNVVNEYNIKKQSSFFDKKLGANDLLQATCSYLVSYSELITTHIDVLGDKIVTSADLRCSVFDLYARVAKATYSQTTTNQESNLKEVAGLTNINFMNSKFDLTNGNLNNLLVSYLSQTASLFCINYNSLNKDEFAANLYNNVKDEIILNQNSSNAERASYYFREVYGV